MTSAGAEPSLAPFAYRDGVLCCEELPVSELVAGLAGPGAWVVSRAAVLAAARLGSPSDEDEGALSAASSMARHGDDPPAGDGAPYTVTVGHVGPVEVLALLLGERGWAGVHSAHELALAEMAGVPGTRTVALGAVKDDGFLKDALVRGVAVLEVSGEHEAGNVARIAEAFAVPVPPSSGAPPLLPALALAGTGGLLARALAGPPDVALDAGWPLPPHLHDEPGHELLALSQGPARAATVSFLSRAGEQGAHRLTARLHGDLARGDWVALPTGLAASARPPDVVHPELPVVLVAGATWRFLDERPLPPKG